MSNGWSMEDIISGKEKEEKKPEAPKSTLQMLAAAKPKTKTPPTPLTPVTGVKPVTGVTPLTPVAEEQPIAPVKNFQKVSNTITRQAIPAGVFKSGKSKELYDVLYSLTRGAVTPARTIRISKPKLQKLAGIGAPQTLSQGLMHLQLVGLVRIVNEAPGGKHEGHEYEVFLYEETLTWVTPLTPVSGVRNLPHLPPLESNPGYPSLNVENKTSSDDAKTSSLKTNTKNDDEAFAVLNEKFSEAVLKLTGRKPSKMEAKKWGDLADLLILELELAAKRTGGVSSVPGFLTEVLRRRLILNQEESKPVRGQGSSQGKPNWVEVGKAEDDVESSYNPETGEYDIKPLDKAGKSKALELVREAQSEGGDFLEDLRKWYLPEDWNWLMNQLQAEQPGKHLKSESKK